MKEQQLPMAESWKPDPIMLRNLEYVAESEDFRDKIEEYLDPRSGFAEVLVERLLRKHHASTNPVEVGRYVSLFINYLADPERCSDERG
jgi:hypothetical protein